jgi:anthraniloyl-CoA monooxygenase
MKLQRIAVLGGGPGGLYAARLLKRSHPDADVTVYEQGSPDTTFGFGVGLASRTQRNLRDADPASLEAIVDVAYSHEMSMQVGDAVSRLSHGELLAIARNCWRCCSITRSRPACGWSSGSAVGSAMWTRI